jgi:MFS family permease
MVADFGAITGPLVAGWLADAMSYQWAFGVSAAVVGLALVAALRMPRTIRPVG